MLMQPQQWTRASRYLAPVLLEPPLHASVTSHQLLLQNGYIHQHGSGFFSLLPLAFRVLQNVKAIVRDEFAGIGAEEVYLPMVTEAALWKTSGRWEQAGEELFRLKDRRNNEYCLAATHEETVTSLIAANVTSYRQLPVYVYQTQTKFRDEIRPRHGLLRSREFIMKDMYTFDKTPEEAMATYHRVMESYKRIFKRLSLPIEVVAADTGLIGGSLSHEVHVPTGIGEDTIIHCNRCGTTANIERQQQLVDDCPMRAEKGMYSNGSTSQSGREELVIGADVDGAALKPPTPACEWTQSKGVEVGHGFYLGTKYSDMFDATFTGSDGKPRLIEMGCYGIGLSRILSALAEVHHDEEGLLMPFTLAPFRVAVVLIGSKNMNAKEALCDEVYRAVSKVSPGSVIVDDRVQGSLGARVSQLRGIGIPFVVLVGDRSVADAAGALEVQLRTESHSQKMSLQDLLERVCEPLSLEQASFIE